MTLVSRNIRYLRRLHGMTQEEFSKKIGIKRSLLGAYEEERASPNLTNLINMAKAFEISVDELITLDIRKIREAASVFPEGEVNLFKEIEVDYDEEAETEDEDFEEEDMEETTEKNTAKKSEQSWDEEYETYKRIKALLEREKADSKIEVVETKTEVKEETKEVKEVVETIKQPDVKETEPEQVKKYPTVDKDLFSQKFVQAEDFMKREKLGDVPLINISEHISYLSNYDSPEFLTKLPQMNLSLLDKEKEYRAFEMDADFPVPCSIVIGEYFKNWYNLVHEAYYVLVTQRQGIVYGQIENRLKSDGYFLVYTNHPEFPVFKLPVREIFEVWQPILVMSSQMPKIGATQQNTKINTLVEELQNELKKLRG